ncbi:MAG: hypothetical protein PHX93_05410 [Candidatus Peribacteraceae bacterium]|jgi:hypothetical protein|nr:hypothetical protein [Candidatus Peribacteraceae bacterium]
MERIPPSATGSQVLRDADNLVVKIGGENSAQFGRNFLGAHDRIARGQHVTHVISALRGARNGGFNTTSHLIDVARALHRHDVPEALSLVAEIAEWTRDAIRQDLSADSSLVPSERAGLFPYLTQAVDQHVQQLRLHILSHTHGVLHAVGEDWVLRNGDHFSITGWGEHLAQALHWRTGEWRGQATAALHVEGMASVLFGTQPERLIEDPSLSVQCVDVLREHLRQHLGKHQEAGYRYTVAPGWFPILATERGYSDTGAALVAQAQQRVHGSVVCLIRKMHPVCTSDPAAGESEVIPRLDYAQALPMVQKGGIAAGVIHPQALRMLAESHIPIVVSSPDDEETERTTLIADPSR